MDARDGVPVLTVRDVSAAVEAFRTVLGFDVVRDLGWMATVAEPGGGRVLVVAESAVSALASDLDAQPVVRVA
ncbi:VOC family protein [Phycicoccus flavus]|uniref:hypothetical protein n=1 Tax=Phycicoccus flavus TaxID=2502783 RepID=UPI000FEBA95E|nr:hypothetical protein [Phycicoccus flavus]NHA68117.1 hypothetical protein [Phycicoccus flavus]